MRDACGLAKIERQGLQSTLRRGWCYSFLTFKERMLGLAEDLLSSYSTGSDRGGNYRGAELRAYGIKRAEAIIAAGFDIFELNEESLGEMKKGADEKLLIASLVREETAVKARWLAERL